MPGSTCKIIEIKPNSSRALDESRDQVNAYKRGLETWYQSNKDELFSKHPKIKECERDGKELSVEVTVEPYEFCPSSSDAKGFGEDLGEATPDVPESD